MTWTTKPQAQIRHRSAESVRTLIELAAQRLADTVTNPYDDEGTVALVTELDNLAKEIY
jgi:hypothetical protein